jgi:hypothetical protein
MEEKVGFVLRVLIAASCFVPSRPDIEVSSSWQHGARDRFDDRILPNLSRDFRDSVRESAPRRCVRAAEASPSP